VVVDPAVLLEELEYLSRQGVDTSGLRISTNVHLIMPYHKKLDEVEEERRGEHKIGTTKRGIGPAYMDKAARVGMRMVDLLDEQEFKDKLSRVLAEKNYLLERVYQTGGFELEAIFEEYMGYARQIHRYITDTSLLINNALDKRRDVLFEGAQGTLLDMDHGTYPFVTSSHPTAGGACMGAGIGPTRIDQVIGVCKAYTTRVGEGPFPTQLDNEIGDEIRKNGAEFGTTTGRPRRCGWFDAVILRYAVRVNGLSSVALTKLDVLDSLDTVKICTGYKFRGREIREFPHSLKQLSLCEPVYDELPGWEEDTSGVRKFSDLPVNAQKYIKRIEELTGVEAAIVAVGPKRSQTIAISKIF